MSNFFLTKSFLWLKRDNSDYCQQTGPNHFKPVGLIDSDQDLYNSDTELIQFWHLLDLVSSQSIETQISEKTVGNSGVPAECYRSASKTKAIKHANQHGPVWTLINIISKLSSIK